jgi:hypothetical protein
MPPAKKAPELPVTDDVIEADTDNVVSLNTPVPMPDIQHDPARQSNQLAQVPARWASPPPELIAKLPKGGTQLDYMGHADVTLALISVDPLFDYGWLTNEDGTMLTTKVGDLHVLEGWVTLHGHKRRGIGTCEARKHDIHKELIGDLLRNCAMRFGIATTLWSKAERHEWGVPQDPMATKAFDALKDATVQLNDEQKTSLRTWWTTTFGDLPVSADAGFECIVQALAQVTLIASQPSAALAIESSTSNAEDAVIDAFPGAEVIEEGQ